MSGGGQRHPRSARSWRNSSVFFSGGRYKRMAPDPHRATAGKTAAARSMGTTPSTIYRLVRPLFVGGERPADGQYLPKSDGKIERCWKTNELHSQPLAG